jgi:hypothetical protein
MKIFNCSVSIMFAVTSVDSKGKRVGDNLQTKHVCKWLKKVTEGLPAFQNYTITQQLGVWQGEEENSWKVQCIYNDMDDSSVGTVRAYTQLGYKIIEAFNQEAVLMEIEHDNGKYWRLLEASDTSV